MQPIARQNKPNFKSKGEVKCARVFEKFLPDWKAVEGKTYEHPIGFQRAVDFKVNQLLVEYHPIDLRREILNPELLKAIQDGLRHSPVRLRKKVMLALKNEYAEQYTKRRKQLVRSSLFSEVRESELVCCFDKYDIYEKVILRFNARVSHKEFSREWNK